jgi:hypothetical protein
MEGALQMSEQQDGQSKGREDNAATTDYPEVSNVKPESYPAVDQRDAVERTGRTEQTTGEDRSFEPPANPEPRRGAGDTSAPPSTTEGRIGPQGDPVEGKR